MTDISKEIYQTQCEIDRIKAKKDPLITEKRETQQKLSNLTSLIRSKGRWPDKEYKSLCALQRKYKTRLFELDNEIHGINKELRSWFSYDNELRAKVALSLELPVPKSNLELQIKNLMNKYLDFAEDQTRVNSMRVMASQIANDLSKLLESPEKKA